MTVVSKAERVPAAQSLAADNSGNVTVTAVSAERPPENTDAAVTARINLSASTTLEDAERYLTTLKDKLDATTSARTKVQIAKVRAFIKQMHDNGNATSGKEEAQRALKDAVTVKTFIEAQAKFQNHALLPVLNIDENDGGEQQSAAGQIHTTSAQDGIPAAVPPLPL